MFVLKRWLCIAKKKDSDFRVRYQFVGEEDRVEVFKRIFGKEYDVVISSDWEVNK